MNRKFLIGLTLVGALAAPNVFALGTVDNAQITAAFASGKASLEVVTTGIIAMGATLTALGIVFGWLRK